MNDRIESELAMPRVRLRDVLAIVNGAAFLLMATGRIAREVRRWREESRRSKQARQGQGQPRRRNRRPRWKLLNREQKTMGVVTLYRPVGQKEFDLIAESGFTAFPPRLPEQPLFYPVLNEAYATQIARDWNTKDAFSGYVGYVLRFDVQAEYLSHYAIHTVGGLEHKEYWIPAEDLPTFNGAIMGKIEVVNKFEGENGC